MKFEKFASNLFLHETLHFVSGIIIGVIIYYLYDRLDLSLIAFLVCIFIDLDHFLESVIIYRFNPVLIIKKTKCNSWLQSGKMTILFHSWELILFLLLLGWKFHFMSLAVTGCVSMATHYLIDTLVYSLNHHMPFYNYLFCYRAWLKFDFVKLYNNGKKKYMSREEIYKKYEGK